MVRIQKKTDLLFEFDLSYSRKIERIAFIATNIFAGFALLEWKIFSLAPTIRLPIVAATSLFALFFLDLHTAVRKATQKRELQLDELKENMTFVGKTIADLVAETILYQKCSALTKIKTNEKASIENDNYNRQWYAVAHQLAKIALFLFVTLSATSFVAFRVGSFLPSCTLPPLLFFSTILSEAYRQAIVKIYVRRKEDSLRIKEAEIDVATLKLAAVVSLVWFVAGFFPGVSPYVRSISALIALALSFFAALITYDLSQLAKNLSEKEVRPLIEGMSPIGKYLFRDLQ